MIEFVLAAVVLLDPASGHGLKSKPVQEKISAASTVPAGAVLSNVAVTLECTARASGRVEGCKVLGETHPGLGFGEAAIALMRDVEVAPGPRDVQFARTFQFMP